MTSRRISGLRTLSMAGDPLPQKRAARLVAHLFGSCALFVAALAGLMAGGSLTLSGAAGASTGITVNCPTDNLQNAIYAAPAGSTILVSGTCTGTSLYGNFYINKDLTLTGPAVLDGSANPATTLNVAAGTVVLNNITIQGGTGSFGLGGGIWNMGQLTLNHSTVTHNTASSFGGVWNMGQLTLIGSTVSYNTATTYGPGGIYNCGVNSALNPDGFCLGTSPGVPRSSLTVINSSVSNNVGGSQCCGGGIVSDPQTVMTITNSTVSGNNGGGIGNGGTATINNVTISWNVDQGAGGIQNNGTATINNTTISNNSSTGGADCFCGGGGLSNGLSNMGTTTINNSVIEDNSAAFVGGGISAGGGPMMISNSVVKGNSAGAAGGGLFVWNGPTTVTNSAFSNNPDQAPPIPDYLPGVWVSPPNYLGFGNNPTFTTNHSTYTP